MTVMTRIQPAQAGDPTPVTALGNGFNVFTGEALPSVLTPVASNPGAVSIEANAYVCTTTEQIFRVLEIDASVAVGTPWGSFKDKLDFVDALAISSTSVVIIVRAARVVSASVMAAHPSFAVPQTSAEQLFNQAGNAYVSAVSMGGEFIAAFTFTASDESHFTELQNSAEAQFSKGAWSFDASFDVRMSNMATSSQSTWGFSQLGVGFSTTPLPAPDKFVDFVLNFSQVDLNGPEVTRFSLSSYSTIEGCPAGFDQIDIHAAQFTQDGDGYADKMALAIERQALVQSVMDFYAHYNASDPALATAKTNLSQDVQQVRSWVASVLANPTDPNPPMPIFKGIEAGVPVPQYGLWTGQAFGGYAGNPFTDLTLDNITQGYRFSTFAIKGEATLVTGLATFYSAPDPADPPLQTYHGGSDGSFSQSYQLADNEHVTLIEASGLSALGALKITTNLNEFPGWPVDPIKTKIGYQAWSTPKDMMFVGWSGRSDGFVNNLAPLYVAFSPAVWLDAIVPPPKPIPPAETPRVAPPWFRPSPAPLIDIDVLTPIANWARSQWPTIQQIFLQKGGWEGWAQVEIARMLQQQFPRATIIRENPVYQASLQRCDISLQLPPAPGQTSQIIELKCESLWQDSSANHAFCTAYATDLQKILQNALLPGYRPATLWAVGFTCTDQIAEQVNSYPFGVSLQFARLGSSSTGDLYMWWYGAQQS